ncbi:bile acid:sodium symporter family protein, partial [Acinetobacter gyllenbergii]|uniref:bile acid:sodium symporter family protein n=1 Tax=Acinetobacter gyllenbergii TaxID=134534 RepID=UPI003AF69706
EFSKVIQVFLIIIVAVCLGMLVRYFSPNVADKLHKPVRTFAVVFLILIIIGAVAKERNSILEYIMQVGLATSLFCIASLLIGYFIPRIFGISSTQARACAFEIGIHNSTLAMTIALTILASTTIAMPAAVYSIFMYIFAAIFGTLLNRYE